jgi:hypothetical protein
VDMSFEREKRERGKSYKEEENEAKLNFISCCNL